MKKRVRGKKSFIYRDVEINEIPYPYRETIKANREFMAKMVWYEKLFKDIAFAESLFEWNADCKKMIAEYEKLIERQQQGMIASIDDYLFEKHEIAGWLEDTLDNMFNPNSENDDEIILLERVYEDLRKTGYETYCFLIEG